MWFDFHNKVIFQHLFKCGGHSIYQALTNYRQHDQDILMQWKSDSSYRATNNVLHCDVSSNHITFDHFNVIWPKINFTEYYKFAFVRNTYECLVAGYKHSMQRAYYSGLPPNLQIEHATNYTFEKHIKSYWMYDFMQWDYLTFKGEFIMDFVGRFENLQPDFNEVCNKLGYPRQQLSKLNSANEHDYILDYIHERKGWHYSQWYTDELIDIVSTKAKKEIEYFKFDFQDQR